MFTDKCVIYNIYIYFLVIHRLFFCVDKIHIASIDFILTLSISTTNVRTLSVTSGRIPVPCHLQLVKANLCTIFFDNQMNSGNDHQQHIVNTTSDVGYKS